MAPHLSLTKHSRARMAAAAARALVNPSWTLSPHARHSAATTCPQPYPMRPHPFVPTLLRAPKSQAVLTSPIHSRMHTCMPPLRVTVSRHPMLPTPPGAARGSTPPSTALRQ
ncbi:hypothetical protein K439DRAFT_1637626 [Ramaria rubella]|nr:hypothetical protein K439DRAFT_1637626 [Ramaria rubella]